MKHVILILLLLIISIFSSCGNKSFLTDEEKAWLESLEEGEISVLFGYDAPPDAFMNEAGVYTGFLVDYYREVEKIIGYQFPIKYFSTWHELIEYSKTGENFIIIGALKTASREEYLDFSEPFFTQTGGLVTRADSDIQSLQDLAGKRICAIESYAISETVEKILPELELIPVKSDMEGLLAVMNKEFDGMLNHSLYSEFHIVNQHLEGLIIHDNFIGSDYDYHIATSRGDKILISIINKALKQITPDRKNELTDYWRSKRMKKVDPRIWKSLFFIMGILLFIVLVILTWSFSLKRVVNRQTQIILESENERIDAAKTQSLKVLAGGISHDFNNLLTGLYAIIEIVNSSLENQDIAKKYLNLMTKSLDDSFNLNKQLISFAQGGDTEKRSFSPGEYIREIVKFSLHGIHLNLVMEIEENLKPITADKGQIGQVISNLVINAYQAMPDNGSLWVTAFNNLENDKETIEISIRDNGPGIPKEIQKRIFDPYFTTKEEGKGLGLASCSSIITGHEGKIKLHSKEGYGTEFTIILPVTKRHIDLKN